MTTFPESTSRTYIFLFTDLVGSTRLWELHPQAMMPALARHDDILRTAVEESYGEVVKTTGDGLMASFTSILDAMDACLKAQINLQTEPWGDTGPLSVRMGVHVGEARPRSGDYYSPAVNRAARLMSAAHGGQVLLSASAADLIADQLPERVSLRDLGEHRLKDLDRPEHIFQLEHPDLKSEFPPIASLNQRPNNLPALPTALIGREAELGEITHRLGSNGTRLLTLTGPGGIGKTRLSIQATADLIDNFPDGGFFVDLAPIRDPNAVAGVIARIVGIKETSERGLFDEVKLQLRSKKMLLLLDNFEQVTAATPMVAEMLRDCPNLKVLVTSREALRLQGEYVFPVPPLGLPDRNLKSLSIAKLVEYESVQLFLRRAQTVNPNFELTEENGEILVEICQRLDGLPLAIELAAARIRLFSLPSLLERLGSRLILLKGGARDLPDRQQTLRDAIDWSYELLNPGEQRLFEMLAVFNDGCTFEAVEAIEDMIGLLKDAEIDILDGLTSLVDKSLIRQINREDGEPRFMMLETIREFAAEKLEDNLEFHKLAQKAYAEFFAEFTSRQWKQLSGGGRASALLELSSDIENVRTAWRYWSESQDLEQLSKFVDSLWLFYDAKGWYYAIVELANDLLTILSTTPSTPELVEKEIILQTSLARVLLAIKGYTLEVEQAYSRALDLCQKEGEIPQLFPVLRGLASFYTYIGDFEKSVQMGEKILNLAESLNDAEMLVEGHLVLGYSLAFFSDMNLGLEHLEKAIASYKHDQTGTHRFKLGNNPVVVSLNASALILWMLGFPDTALQRAQEAVALARKLDHPYSLAYALYHTGLLHFWRREFEKLEVCAEDVLEIAREHEFEVWEAVATCLRGAALAGKDQPEDGLNEVRRGIDLYQGLNTPPVFWPLLLLIQAGVCGQVGKANEGLNLIEELMAIERGSGSGQAISPEFMRIKGNLILLSDPSRTDEAEIWFRQALGLAKELKANMMELRAAISLCLLLRDQGRMEEGKSLLSGVYEKFTEGFKTTDLIEAKEILGI